VRTVRRAPSSATASTNAGGGSLPAFAASVRIALSVIART
jgi:hypothetical protein